MSLTIPNGMPEGDSELIQMLPGAKRVIALFLITIATAVSFHSTLGLPPVIGMMTGLGYLQFFGYYLKITHLRTVKDRSTVGDVVAFDIFR